MLQLRRFKNISMIMMSIILLSTITFQATAETDKNHVAVIRALGKTVPVYVQGKGLPMLVVGPANLFRNELLPKQFYNYFTIYFVDLFTEVSSDSLNNRNAKSDEFIDVNALTFDNLVDAIESIRQQLKLNKMILFGHSSNGILALKYSEKFPEHVWCDILIGTTPFRGTEKMAISENFFKKTATADRKKLYENDQKELAKRPHSYIAQYNAKRAFNFFEPLIKGRENVWKGINMDERLVKKFFSLADSFDIRKNPYILKVPVFLGLGKYDYTCPPSLWLVYSKNVLDSSSFIEYFVFDKSAHYPMIENEHIFMEKILQFFCDHKIGNTCNL